MDRKKYRFIYKKAHNWTRNIRRWVPAEIKIRLNRKSIKRDYKNIPIVINNYNRLTMLLKLIDSLTSRGYYNIHILDNASTYKPLIEWYSTCPYTLYRLEKNYGHLALWKSGLYKMFWGQYYAYTDPDIEIHPDCPDDFMEKFIKLLDKYPKALKAGFSICIDDLPDHFERKKNVQEWESQFWKKELEPNVFNAPIDTTFAVYKPYFKGEGIKFFCTYIRVGFPYSIRHLPWYVDSKNLDEEEKYYISKLHTETHWSELSKTPKGKKG